MTEKRPLFRPEAVEHHARGRVGVRTLDLRQERTIWLFRGLLGLLAVALLLAFTIQVDHWAGATAVVDADGRTVRLVPDENDTIEEGATVTVRIGDRSADAVVAEVVSSGEGPDEGRAELSSALPPGTGRARARIGERSLAKTLLGRD